jgi:general secretion pathway protein H
MKGQDEGFSLIEMVAVLVLLALAAAAMLPAPRTHGSGPALKAFALETAAYLRLARTQAIAQNREAVVLFDFDSRTVRADGLPPDVLIPVEISVALVTASDEVNRNSASIRFFPDGSASGGNISVSDGSRKMDIAVNWLTGAVVIAAP